MHWSDYGIHILFMLYLYNKFKEANLTLDHFTGSIGVDWSGRGMEIPCPGHGGTTGNANSRRVID